MTDEQITARVEMADQAVKGLEALKPVDRTWLLIIALLLGGWLFQVAWTTQTSGERTRQFLDAADQRRQASINNVMQTCDIMMQRMRDDHREQRAELTAIIDRQGQQLVDFQNAAIEADERTGSIAIDAIERAAQASETVSDVIENTTQKEDQ